MNVHSCTLYTVWFVFAQEWYRYVHYIVLLHTVLEHCTVVLLPTVLEHCTVILLPTVLEHCTVVKFSANNNECTVRV